jgi:SAM-dependent methyltransferase
VSPSPSLRAASSPSSFAGSQTAGAAVHPARDAFDRIAANYDDDFTASLIGSLQRKAVWRHLDARFTAGDRILDLGCGTGADAIHLARRGINVEAVDVSQRMIAEALRKIAAAKLTARIRTSVLAIEDLAAWDGRDGDTRNCLSHQAPFDGVLSNFGAINCVQQLRPVALALSRLIRPGGHLLLGLIGRFCLWEAIFYGVQGRFQKAARRWGSGGRAAASLNGSAEFPVYYRPVREVVEAFRPAFRLERHRGIGILVPPSYLESQARRVPKLMKLGAEVDRAISAWPVCRAAADHTLLVFRRERSC